MIIVYIAGAMTGIFVMCILSFWIGRCARRLPIIDDNLPWTISLDQAARCSANCKETCIRPSGPPRWPNSRLPLGQ